MGEEHKKRAAILVIEDDAFMANMLRARLEEEDYSIEIADNGEDALEMLDTVRPKLILLDLIMPKLDGFGFLEQLRANDKHSKTHVIVTTNLGQQEDHDKVAKYDVDDYVVKAELDIDDLLKKIQNILK